MIRRARLWTSLVFALCAAAPSISSGAGGELRLTVVDRATGQPIPCRMHLRNAKGAPRKVAGHPYWHDHFVFPGKLTLRLPRGDYEFDIERGPEYTTRTGRFTINNFADDEQTIDLARAVNMADEGWWSGELHIHRPVKNIELLMLAEDLHVAPVITWWNNQNPWADKPLPREAVVRFDENRYYDVMAGEDERGGGALLFFNLSRPLDIARAERDYPSALAYLLAAKAQPGAWVDIEKPFWWDVPLWLASGKVDSIGLANNHMQRDGMLADEAWGKPRDVDEYPGPLGNALWSQDIYYHALNCGLRLPPSAGSASGVLPNPVGYNRMYVWVDKEQFSYETWWEGFRLGRVVVTNGPLIRPLANGRLPGHVFQAPAGQSVSVNVTMNLATREPIRYIELVKNGQVAASVRMDEYAKTGTLPPVNFDVSGWLLVRAVTDQTKTHRFASSAPWYVEIGDSPNRISKKSVEFFLAWLDERNAAIDVADQAKREELLAELRDAREFWESRLGEATAE